MAVALQHQDPETLLIMCVSLMRACFLVKLTSQNIIKPII